jgi:tetratricopeptide (TPR) repeat protein
MIRLWVLLMFASCFTMATVLQPHFEGLREEHNGDAGILETLLGDSRRLFANHFFTKADAYFHRGFYPGIFDTAVPEQDSDLSGKPDAHEDDHSAHSPGDAHEKPHDEHDGHDAHHKEMSSFLQPPIDWIERFGRHFIPTQHTHLEGASSREILPWLRLSADMDPKRVQTYVTASYWLRTHMDRPQEAEAFLREGLKANPDSYEILFELGKIYLENKKEPRTAHNIFRLAAIKWDRQESAGLKPDPHLHAEMLGEMVRADDDLNNLPGKLADLEELEKFTANKQAVQDSIDEVKKKLAEKSK